MIISFTSEKKSVQFCWIPSHVGIRGNEEVDGLAQSATALPPSAGTSLPHSASDFFPRNSPVSSYISGKDHDLEPVLINVARLNKQF